MFLKIWHQQDFNSALMLAPEYPLPLDTRLIALEKLLFPDFRHTGKRSEFREFGIPGV